MVMLKDIVVKYYSGGYDLNCAETILYAANEEYKLGLSHETLKAVAGFGGGMAVEEACGAAAGAVAVIGIMFTNQRAHESDRIKKLVGEFMKSFNEKLGTYSCKQLKERYRTESGRCIRMIMDTSDVLDEIVLRERNTQAE
jgi:C_GCAxxG_C_C family probable redox protein